jgi:hypothetical protein
MYLGRSSDFPALSAAFPFRLFETVALKAERVPYNYRAGLQRRDRSRFSRDSLLSHKGTYKTLYKKYFVMCQVVFRKKR